VTHTARLSILSCVAALVIACGEKPQTTNAAVKKSDAQSWQGADNPYVAPGWKEGDRISWEEQLRTRTQTQNEYVKIEN
jgi:hypothetical protein